jgi:hypothetical protein
MLLALKSYLMTHNSVRLEELSNHFNEDPNVIQDMLEHFIRKGQVIKQTPTPACDNCTMGCSGGLEQFTIYQWQKSQKSDTTNE